MRTLTVQEMDQTSGGGLRISGNREIPPYGHPWDEPPERERVSPPLDPYTTVSKSTFM